MTWGRYTHEGIRQSVPAEIIRALGKGCLAGAAGLVLGLAAGTLHLPAAGLLIVAGAAAIGVACLTGSAALKNSQAEEQHGEERRQIAEVLSIVKEIQAEFPDPLGRRFVAELEAGRALGPAKGRTR